MTGDAIGVVDGLAPAIDEAAARAGPRYRFLSASWFAAASPTRPRTLAASGADGAVIAALPVARGRLGIPAVPGPYWPFRSFPVADGLAADALVPLLGHAQVRRTLGPVWRLGPVHDDDPALALLRAAAPRTGWRLVERHLATRFVLDMAELSAAGTWPRSSTLKKNRFHEKHLAAHGALAWRFAQGADWTPELFDALAAVEAKSWHADSRDAKFVSPEHRAHWTALARDPDQAARMHAGLLTVGGEPAAFSFDIHAGDTVHAVANSYDNALARHSPGKCLDYRSLALAQAKGLARVDWGAGDSGYKRTIGAEAAGAVLDVLIVRAPLAGLAARLWRR